MIDFLPLQAWHTLWFGQEAGFGLAFAPVLEAEIWWGLT